MNASKYVYTWRRMFNIGELCVNSVRIVAKIFNPRFASVSIACTCSVIVHQSSWKLPPSLQSKKYQY